MIEGGTFAFAGPGGYAEAAYRDGSRFSASVAYGGGTQEYIWSSHSRTSSNQRNIIEYAFPSDEEEEEDDDRRYLH